MNTTTTPIGLYRRDLTDPARLQATTVGRQHLLDDLLEKLKARGNKKSGQNHLFIGPRGIGKTHLLTLLEQGISNDTGLADSYTVIRFPEESNRVLSFADLLLGIIDLLAGVDDNGWQALHEKLEIEKDDTIIIDSVLPRLKHWHRQTGKTLLIMMENLDILFTRQLKKKQDIHRLRKLLMNNSHIMLIGTAPIFFPALNDVKHPLYDFFDIQIVEDLSQKETLSLIWAHLKWDRRDDLLQQFDQLQPRILAMHTLTGGNPRLITMLYELITEENLSDITARLQQMLDRITPFYQERIKDLPPQERALLETIALMRSIQRTPVNIAKKFRKPRHQTSVLLKRMTEAGYLTVSQNPQDKRSRLYRIKEGFFDIWLAMNESRANRKYLPYLVEFFSLWYGDAQTREKKRQQLREELAQLSAKGQKNALEILTYLSEASSRLTEKQQTKMELAIRQLKLGSPKEAKTLLKETEQLLVDKPKGLLTWMYDKADQWAKDGQPSDLLERMEKIIQYWQQQRAGELEQAARIFHDLRLDFSSHGLHKLHIGLLRDHLGETDNPEQQADLLLQIARSEKYDGQLSAALTTLNRVLDISFRSNDRKLQGTALNNISQIYNTRGDYGTALQYLNKSLKIRQEIGDKAGEGTTLNNISQIYDARGDYDTALQYLNKSLEITQEIGDKAGEGVTLNNISQIFKARGDYDTALQYLNKSLKIRQEIGDKAGEGTTLNNMATTALARGDYDTALQYLNKSFEITLEIGNKAGEGTTLNNISQIYDARGDYDTALQYLNKSLEITQEIGDKAGEGTTLNNMATTAHARGDYDTALQYLNKSLEIRQEIGNKAGEGVTLNNISQIYDARGDYDTALQYLNKSLKITLEIGDKAGEGVTLNNISQIFKTRGDYDTALQYLNKSLKITLEIGDKAGEGATLNNISQIFKARGDYDTALQYLNKSLEITQEIGDKAGEGATLNNISQIFKARGDYHTALQYLNKSLEIRQGIGDVAGLCATLFNMGHIHLQNDEIQEAMQAWVKVFTIAKKIKLAQALEALANLSEQLGLPGGLKGWEKLAKELKEAGK